MRGEAYERYIARLYEEEGYQTSVTRKTDDRGIDVLAEKDGIRIAIQAKHYSRSNRVSSTEVQQYSGLLTRGDIHGVVIATTSSYTQPAREVARNRGIKLEVIPYDPPSPTNNESSDTTESSGSDSIDSSPSPSKSGSDSTDDLEQEISDKAQEWENKDVPHTSIKLLLLSFPLYFIALLGTDVWTAFGFTIKYIVCVGAILALYHGLREYALDSESTEK